MFPAPERIVATAVARLPDKFRRGGRTWVNPDGEALDSFLEAPVFGPEGALYFVDVLNGRIHRLTENGEVDVIAEYDGEPNGLKFGPGGYLYVADFKNGLLICEVSSGSLRPVVERVNGERFKGLNDLIFDRSGRLFFTDQGNTGLHDPTGRTYCLEPDGNLRLLLSNVPSPNGIVISPNGQILYLAVTCANQVWRMRLEAGGAIGKVGVYLHLSGRSGGPDGIAVDAAETWSSLKSDPARCGCLARWVNRCCGSICGAGRMPSNIAFGGPHRTTLYITEAETGTILSAEMPYRGAEIPTFA